METDKEFDLRRNITLGMVKGDDEYDVYLINESQETLEDIRLRSNSTYFDDFDKPVRAQSDEKQLGTLAPQTAVCFEKRSIYDFESHVGYTFLFRVNGEDRTIVLGTPPEPVFPGIQVDHLPVVGGPGYHYPFKGSRS